MSILLQTFGWPDLIIVCVLLLTILTLAIGVVGIVFLSGKGLTWRLLSLLFAMWFIVIVGGNLGFFYVSARLAGAPASLQLLLSLADAAGAIAMQGFIGYIASLPLFHVSLVYTGKIHRKINSSGYYSKFWFALIEDLILFIPLTIALSPVFFSLRSQSVSNVLFGTPEPFDCLRQSANGSRALGINPDCPGRFTVILNRLFSTLGVNRTEFNIVTALGIIGWIVGVIDGLVSLYDRLVRKGGQTPNNHGEELPHNTSQV